MILKFRRRITLVLCAACIILCLFLYILINFSVPTIKQHDDNINGEQEDYKAFLKQPIKTNDFDESGKLVIEEPNFNDNENEVKMYKNAGILNKKDMFNEMVIDAKDFSKCSFNTELAPRPDIQMLDIYQEIPFDNTDGGVWKQGWNIEYDPKQFNKHNKLKVFVVPHSHNDPGWLKTFDDYFEYTTKQILSNAVRHLTENSDMKFIWAEISYFSRFYERIPQNLKLHVKQLVKNKQLEFVTGGWVMPDEANSHWLSILMQLTEGQEWLKVFLNVTPTSSWSIDPFGQSPTMPYILKLSGFKNLLIQRTHYSVKKRLAKEKQLEFRWRQYWDDAGETDLLTHMMPFYSYDIPHTCGPDPKVCCQFDFKRLPGFGLTCPWRIAPQQINDFNVAERANLIVDQWRKKSRLYQSQSVLIPLGDDFRFSQSTEWKAQRENYEKLFDYINNDQNMFVEAKFATLQDYFDSLRKEKEETDFPSLSGDFFTYADRDDHYWSGYYTSRPYHKRMDRVLLHYIRSSEILRSWLNWEPKSKLDELLQNARRQLSLFQHHDGITGTAKDFVVIDYANRMNQAIKDCRYVMQQSVYRLLTKPEVYLPNYEFTYFFMDDSRWPSPVDSRTTIILGDELPTKYVVLHNSLPQWRDEIVEFIVSNPFVEVTDYNMNKIPAQVSYIWGWHKGLPPNNASIPQPSTTKFRLLFKVNLPPLGLMTYVVHISQKNERNSATTFSKSTILTTEPFTIHHSEFPNEIKFAEPREISLQHEKGLIVAFNQNGLLKSIKKDSRSNHFPTHLQFLKYGTNSLSGAYLFLPDGPATKLDIGRPTVLIEQGDLESSITAGLPFATHSTILRQGAPSIEIRNVIDIGKMDNTEIVMRISTGIKNDDIFYTDLNGLQLVKRKRLAKLPLQANYYPIPSSIYIEDDKNRLTLLSAQPLGGSSLKSGEIEIMQDRRLAQDDNRGLAQGVLDNQPVMHIFRLLLENREFCVNPTPNYPGGFLTLKSHKGMQSLLHPVDSFIWNENQWDGLLGVFGEKNEPIEDGLEIGVLKHIQNNTILSKNMSQEYIGVVVHRKYLDECSTKDKLEDGTMNLKRLLDLKNESNIFSAPLTLLKKDQKVSNFDISLCPMDVKAFLIER